MRRKEELISQIYDIINSNLYKPMLPFELKALIEVDQEEQNAYESAVKELEETGKLFFTAKGKCVPPGMMGLITGVFQKSTKDFGFVINNNPDERDIFIHKKNIHGAMSKDIVAIRITKRANFGSRAEGEIVKIIKRNTGKMVCTFFKNKNTASPVARKSEDIYLKPENTMNALDGDKVVVDLSTGRVIEILGHKGDKGINVLSLLREQGFTGEFKENVLKEAESIPEHIEEGDIKNRTDLRNEIIFTIDGNDTKDIDDAVSIVKNNDGIYTLGVHIADVSFYVKEGSNLDKSAFKRGTSVYPVDRVAPMLPVNLSNGICSLNPNVDRFALSVRMDIDGNGNVIKHDIFKSVIKSCEQMTYTNVYKILEENDPDLEQRYAPIVPSLILMKELTLILRERRFKRGAIDFDIPEPIIILNENDVPVEIKKRDITIANIIIEELMIMCNETVAKYFYWMEVPFIYRVHSDPDKDKMQRFREFLYVLGYRMKNTNTIHAKELQDILLKIKGQNEERVIKSIMLRAMQKAVYTNRHSGHFGLAAEHYCHFTSPIRRYPDLMIHRIISEFLEGKMNEDRMTHYNDRLTEIANHCSERERAAEIVERESVKLKMTEYMKQHIGENFSCIISGVAGFGMFVETEELIEGFISVSNMHDDYYIYDENRYELIGERTGRRYKIGDKVTATVEKADVNLRTVEFVLKLR